ncbi:cytokine-dependent hematopoietic cell linker [Morphnus guianensis]
MTPADIFSPFHTENRRTIPANAYHFNKDLTTKGKSDLQSSSKVSEEEEGDYETVSSSTLEAIHALRILPAKPLQESEYADKRCLRPSSTTSPMNSQHISQPLQYSAKHTSVLEGRSMPSVRGIIKKYPFLQKIEIEIETVASHFSFCEKSSHRFLFPLFAAPCASPTVRSLKRSLTYLRSSGNSMLMKAHIHLYRSWPLKTLPKQYQPLPPAPQISSQFFHTRKTLSQAHTFPISAKVTRYGCIPHPHSLRTKTLSPVKPQDFTSIALLLLLKKKKSYSLDSYTDSLQTKYENTPKNNKYLTSILSKLHIRGNSKFLFFLLIVTDLGEKPEASFQAQQYKPKHHPEASLQCTRSSKMVCSSGSTLNVENLSVKRSTPPTPYAAFKNKSKHSLVKRETQSLTQPTEKDLNKYEWYIGEYDRHEAEKALLQENTDETFLVRDCSKKSNAEPYVLVVYYGRKVYNIKVRFLEDSQQYALGTGLRGDDKFNSVKEIIDFYKNVPIILIDGKDKSGIQREQCYLTYPFKSCKRCFLP